MASGSNTFGGTVKLSGESEYRNALKNISAQLGVFSSELNKVSTEFGKNSNSMESNAKKGEILNSRLESQKQKVEVLKSALESAKETYGETDSRTLKWQKSLVDAEADIIATKKEIDSLGNELEESGNQAQTSANGGYTVFKNVIANLATDVIRNALNSFKELGKAVTEVGKQALNSYADYEQLVGGVETLFKDSANVVENYANNAYKTAGLSANEYMETVTSFSASLLQSLGNNTEKSAKYADQAIIDMADNANKMGTSMSSIQSAYQGFAKQNYTMLDNLKLGYGGTKTEMERLIADANKVKKANGEMGNLSIKSFADVTEAIHIIQNEMGITGTTAKEASETISGSLSSMKSAWNNLLTGIANGNADLESLLFNLCDGVMTSANNILPIVEQIANSFIELFPRILDAIIEQLDDFLSAGVKIVKSLITGITSNMPFIMEVVMDIINTILKTVVESLPMILQAGVTVLVELVKGIAQSLPTLVPTIMEALTLIVETLINNIDLIIDAGIQLILGLAEGLINALPDLIDKIPVIIDELINAITNNLPKIIEMGITLTIKLAEGLIKAIPQLVSKIPQIISSIISGLANGLVKMLDMGKNLVSKVREGLVSGLSSITEVGKNLVQGLWNGINNAKDWVLDKIKGFGKAILNGIKGIFGIHSPSTVFRDEIGVNLALGIGEGFAKEMDNVNEKIKDSLPTDFDISSNVNIGTSTKSFISDTDRDIRSASNDVYNINIYSPSDSPSEYARKIREEIQYMKLTHA